VNSMQSEQPPVPCAMHSTCLRKVTSAETPGQHVAHKAHAAGAAQLYPPVRVHVAISSSAGSCHVRAMLSMGRVASSMGPSSQRSGRMAMTDVGKPAGWWCGVCGRGGAGGLGRSTSVGLPDEGCTLYKQAVELLCS
jgi:hypothetical protein